MENFPTKYKDKQNSHHLDVLNQIDHIIQKRTAKIMFHHVYSHTSDVGKTEQEIEKQVEKVNSMLI